MRKRTVNIYITVSLNTSLSDSCVMRARSIGTSRVRANIKLLNLWFCPRASERDMSANSKEFGHVELTRPEVYRSHVRQHTLNIMQCQSGIGRHVRKDDIRENTKFLHRKPTPTQLDVQKDNFGADLLVYRSYDITNFVSISLADCLIRKAVWRRCLSQSHDRPLSSQRLASELLEYEGTHSRVQNIHWIRIIERCGPYLSREFTHR